MRTTGAQIQELWANNSPDWEKGHWKKIDDCLFHLLGNSRFLLPEEFLEGVEGREHMIVVLPQKTTIPLKVVALLGNKRPKIMRYAVGISLPADTVSTNVETWCGAVLDHDVDGRPLVNTREIAGRLLLEGALVVKALSSDAHWRRSLTWLDMIDEEEYDELKPRRRKNYLSLDEVDLLDDEEDDDLAWTRPGRQVGDDGPTRYVRVDEDGIPVPKRRYHRDASGRPRDHGYYKNGRGKRKPFVEDRAASRRAWQEDRKRWLAKRLPFEVELISARHCIPIMDDQERIEAILIARTYESEELLGRDFIWGDDLGALIPDPEDGSVTLYELWHTDERDRPYVSYFVDGVEVTKFRRRSANAEDEVVDAVIDLEKEFGCQKLPVRWFWGLNHPIDNIPEKGVPFLHPVLSSINAAEGIATATHIYAYRNAFSGQLIEINAALIDRYGDILVKGSEFMKWNTAPMEDRVVPGIPHPAVAPPPGAGVQQLLQLLLQSSAAMNPSDAVFGSGQSASGHDRALSKEYMEIALSQVLDSTRMAVKFIMEMILDYAVWISDKKGMNVPVFANVPISQASVEGSHSQEYASQVIELSPSWLKNNTEIHVYYENDDVDELKRAQLAEQHLQGLVSWDEFRTEGWNDPSPEVTLAKIFGDQALRTPEGRQAVLEYGKQLWNDEQLQEKEKLIKDGLLSPDGIPTAARIPFVPKRVQGQAGAGMLPGFAPPGAPIPGAPGAAGLPPGVIPPPGVPASLLARHMQLDASHAAARANEAPSGPLGPIGGPANPGGEGVAQPLPGMGPGGPQGYAPFAPPPTTLPPGQRPATDINQFPKQWAAAPKLKGMGGSGLDPLQHALGGVIAGELEKASRNYHNRRRAGGKMPSRST